MAFTVSAGRDGHINAFGGKGVRALMGTLVTAAAACKAMQRLIRNVKHCIGVPLLPTQAARVVASK